MKPNHIVMSIAALVCAFTLFAAPASAQCINGTQFGVAVFSSCNETFITATTCAFAGEFSTFNNLVAGYEYEFASTGGSGNYITITDTANNALAWGFPPLVWTSTLTGAVRVHVSTSALCGTETSCHAVRGRCLGYLEKEYVLDTGDPNERVCNPKSYTDLGNGIVLDNETRLEWMQATAPGTYTWQEALDYIDELNDNETLGLGYDDWRLPTIEELSTLVDAGRYNPAIDPIFSDTVASDYWSSTAFVASPGVAWYVNFYDGVVLYGGTFEYSYVRAVRGGPYGSLDNFVINGDGTVTDTVTDLMWQQCNYGQTWSETECTGSAATGTWDEAGAYVQELNDNNTLGYEDWRLPTRNELQSIVDYSRWNTATTFPNTASYYWSSTAKADNTDYAWRVEFLSGRIGSPLPPNSSYVRAVRGGQCTFNGDCVFDADCYDGIFCNGPEQCEAGECVPGEPPFCPRENPVCDERITGCVGCLANADCAEGEICDEALNSCVTASECTADDNCTDTLFCTGIETCVANACVDGPGDPCEAGETCDEALDICVAVPECTADVDCDDNLYCNGEETCAAGVCEPGTNPCGEDQTCDEVGNRCVECLNDSQCVASERCADNVCIARCTLAVEYKKPVAAKLKNDKNVRLKITGGEGFDPYGVIDLGPFEAVKPKVNTKKNSLKVKAVVPAGTDPGTYPISVGDCIGEIEIL